MSKISIGIFVIPVAIIPDFFGIFVIPIAIIPEVSGIFVIPVLTLKGRFYLNFSYPKASSNLN
jgi:hypothetical protein